MTKICPTISFIIPTLNEQKLLPIALASIKKQKYPQDKIEVIVVDGGSSDRTKEIAREEGCLVLENNKKFPEPGIFIGLKKAQGDYAILMGADEEIVNPWSLVKKIELFQQFPEVKNVASTGLATPKNYPMSTAYANACGDPFSFFIYRIASSDYLRSCRHMYGISKKNEVHNLIVFTKEQQKPLLDGGNHCFDLRYLKSTLPLKSDREIAEIFTAMSDKTLCVGINADDYINHRTSTSWKQYLSKIRWRIISNVNAQKKTGGGIVNREKYYTKSYQWRKYLFIPVTLTIVCPLIFSVYYALIYRNAIILLHTPLALYTLFYIFYYKIRQILKIKKNNSEINYGKI